MLFRFQKGFIFFRQIVYYNEDRLFNPLFSDLKFEDAVKKIASMGCDAIEIGTGNFPGDAHCKVDELLNDDQKRNQWKKVIEDNGLIISALSCHGNPIHPNKEIAKANHEVHRKTVKLANKLGIDTVVGFSGCPGSNENDIYPNWVTCAWPPDFEKIVNWQWEKR